MCYHVGPTAPVRPGSRARPVPVRPVRLALDARAKLLHERPRELEVVELSPGPASVLERQARRLESAHGAPEVHPGPLEVPGARHARTEHAHDPSAARAPLHAGQVPHGRPSRSARHQAQRPRRIVAD